MGNRLLREGLAELIGTFMLVLVGAGAVTVLSTSRSPLPQTCHCSTGPR
jgi:glycerol uptake facilitator-like aquaporin